ncbi:hypothetical protein SAMN05216312_101345 [Cohnella sp. OV330]|uniref:hypothetical protein n=1 Tax=Cohnella sp. OV330 TaxID=1855288 RepID=UPI0008F37621|nr:hypothetical protein [Cohnella sp. OV330]SFA76355.1 hypothetical protein SAMN05216312_101345 [Cohnella sp. OV330]
MTILNRLLAVTILAGVLVTAIGCASSETNPKMNAVASESASIIAEQTIQPSTASVSAPIEASQETSAFALKVGDELLHLQDWDDRTDLEGLLGKPLSQKTEALKNA